MKKIILIVLMAQGSYCQAMKLYSFSYSTYYYEFLKGPTTSLMYAWRTSDLQCHLGVGIGGPLGAYGAELFSDGSVRSYYSGQPPDNEKQIFESIIFGGLCDRGIYDPSSPSEIVYQIDTIDPHNRIFKLEFRNMGLKNGNASNSFNFQMWFFQEGGFEYHFGPQDCRDVAGNTRIGMEYKADGITNYYYVAGSHAYPYTVAYETNMISTPGNQDLKYSIGRPAKPTGVDRIRNHLLSLYPIPARDFLEVRVEGDGSVLPEISDISGRFITVPVLKSSGGFRLDVSSLPVGTYILSLRREEAILRRKFIKI